MKRGAFVSVLSGDDPLREGGEQISRRLVLQARLNLLRQQEDELLKKIQSVKAALSEEESLQNRLNQQVDVGPSELRPPPPPPMSC